MFEKNASEPTPFHFALASYAQKEPPHLRLGVFRHYTHCIIWYCIHFKTIMAARRSEEGMNNTDVTVSDKEEESFSLDLSLLQVMDFELESLDPALQREYRQALEEAPVLVKLETRWIDFLRTENMDPAKAANRLALYWKYRKECFGDERWLLPMTQTGHGALNDMDILFLRTGYSFSFTRNEGGGPICLLDMSRVPVYPPGFTNIRIGYYVSTVLTDPSFQTEGLTVITIITSARRPAVADLNPRGWKMFREGLPLRTKTLLVAQAYEPYKQELLDFLTYQEVLTAGFRSLLHPNCIRGDSTHAVLERFHSRFGIDRKYLPPAYGGDMNYSAFE